MEQTAIPAQNSAVAQRVELVARGRRLEYLTIGWNTFEAVVALVSGLLAGSVALVGFGLDSVIETCRREFCCGDCALWSMPKSASETARRLVGICFLLLAVYIAARLRVRAMDEGSAGAQSARNSDRRCRRYCHAIAWPCQAARRRTTSEWRAALRFAPGGFLRIPFRDPACRPIAARAAGMVVGRSCGRAGHGADHRARGRAGITRGRVRVRFGLSSRE